MRTLCGTVLAAVCAVFSCNAEVVRDIQYDSSIDRFGLGDLFLPEAGNGESAFAGATADKRGTGSGSVPIVLTIHGGGWSSGDRASWEGVARFFTERLGFAAFNIEYRLASVSNRWPACGNDCVNAARFVLSDEFKKRFSLSHDKIWICGGSAGGHLALWTLTHLPVGDVAGCVSISAIGDPVLDYAVHAGRYKALFGEAVRSASAPYHAGDGRAGAHPASASFAVRASRSGDMRTPSALAAMDPRKAIAPSMAPVLCTHATEDKVVPIASHKAFADAYRNVGNVCEFFEYSATIREGLTGHCIWIPGSKPHRLIPEIESTIAAFVRNQSQED